MKILIVGSGGREHALAWKVKQSPRLSQLYVAPGNAGTAQIAENVPIQAEAVSELVALVREKNIDLVIIGPESALAAGLADGLQAVGCKVFGPTRAAAEIESSKTFSKAFMLRHQIPTARFGAFDNFQSALDFLHRADYPVVLKASGLAAGKGVILPENVEDAETALRRIMLDREFGGAGEEVVIEERLSGEEVSLFGFSDGTTVRPMPSAQDHKRIFDGDEGPNTGGMGAYAPAPICPPQLAEQFTREFLQPTVDGLRQEGRPFVGILYAGLMLTPDGPRCLEFNCRFGDPETQVLMPLLASDFLEIAEACADGRLAEVDVRWKSETAACVVLASEGYPGKYPIGREIRGLEVGDEEAIIFHAGTKSVDNRVVTAGGRVLCVTGLGATIPEALKAAYAAVERIEFEGAHFRRDIGWRIGLQADGKRISG
jgi:phosphoribosylamine---glycine ligase